jgi:hypothetical protein
MEGIRGLEESNLHRIAVTILGDEKDRRSRPCPGPKMSL